MKNASQYLWWHTGIIYQIYPRSYQDSNADGIGDLRGIIERLDYLQWLGVNVIWLSPVYPSPMADFGYDISDYTGIHPLFGTMADFDELLDVIHLRGMKLILDFVPNHTSDKHPWFVESRSSRDNLKRDWYIWKDPGDDGSVPNNWLSVFGGSAWEWDEQTRQYYYHGFLKEQPDLNWRNPEVQDAMLEVMRFWLEKGVDGFRVDVLWHLIKDQQYPDNPPNPDYQAHMPTYDQLLPVYSTDQPEVHDIISRMRSLLDSYDDRLMIGEIYLPIQKLMLYYGVDNKGAHLPFNFQLIDLPWIAQKIARAVDEYEAALPPGGWPNWVLGNHDRPRIATRVGIEQARIAAMLLLTLRGTPTIYYGDELGMRDVPIPFEEIQDPQGLNMPDKNLSRDPARTPMQWDCSANGGFSSVRPWLRVDEAFERENVQVEREDRHSMLSLYKRLIELRQKEQSLITGAYEPVECNEQTIAYIRRESGHSAFFVLLNLSNGSACFNNENRRINGFVNIATSPHLEGRMISGKINLNGNEGIIVRLAQ
ncbi:alpha-glucosidase [Arcticibacter tournemirensis]|uniref:Alpha-amylase n=1 Tax=Arcticibacter tournemirensis TaxID=699437 RepID=A0A5M9H9L4_9SPHI|nr:alpha-amylase family glycosyl hydrolase [Arcticibacter tournemirensis]KAA8483616.1 alpha-amylase [Arcticibacter tournemirensis]TQM51431.1 alpha-glucosidase [Arcticibacter tournemirensis]